MRSALFALILTVAACLIAVPSLNADELEDAKNRFARGDQIAVIDVDRVLANFDSYQRKLKVLSDESAALKRKFPPQEPGCGHDVFRGIDPRVAVHLAQSTMPAGFEKALAQHRQMVAERYHQAREQQLNLQRRADTLTGEANAELRREIAKVCESRGFQLVLRQPLYFQEPMDITDELIARLNAVIIK